MFHGKNVVRAHLKSERRARARLDKRETIGGLAEGVTCKLGKNGGTIIARAGRIHPQARTVYDLRFRYKRSNESWEERALSVWQW